MAARRKALIDAVTSNNEEEFASIVRDHVDKKSSFCLVEVLSELSSEQLDDVWRSLYKWIEPHCGALVTLLDQPQATTHAVQTASVLVLAGSAAALASVSTSLHTTAASNNNNNKENGAGDSDKDDDDEDCDVDEAELDQAADLHKNSISVNAFLAKFTVCVCSRLLLWCQFVCLDRLSETVCQLAELWCRRRLPGCRQLAPHVLVFLSQQLLTPGAKPTKSLVQRLASLVSRYLLSGSNGDTSGNTAAAAAVCRAAGCAQLLTLPAGRRLIQQLLAHNRLRPVVHDVIKRRLTTAARPLAAKYGACYYNAWRHGDTALRQALENRCLSDLMYHAVHARRHTATTRTGAAGGGGGGVWRPLYQLLHQWHTHNSHRDTADMLHRLYTPILWRALSAVNSTVQLNAAHILFDVFPLESPLCDRQSRDRDLHAQCTIMVSLLTEQCHRVRVVATQGACKVLSQYWDLVPMQHKTTILQTITQQLAFDASSSEVRHQAVNGLIRVLDSPLSHAYMTSVLPFVAAAFHDQELCVRVAMCDLLLLVKTIHNIRYFDVVPVKHLLARLACDQPPICRRLVKLMVNSFFPVNESDETILTRCIHLAEQNVDACRQFYLHSSSAIDVGSAVRLIVAIRQALVIHVRLCQQQQQQDRTRRTRSTDNKENSGSVAHSGKRRLHSADERSVLSDASQDSGSSDESVSSNATHNNTNTNNNNSDVSVRPDEDGDAGRTRAGSVLDRLSVVAALLDVVGVLWSSRLAQLVEQPTLEQGLHMAWTRAAPLLYSFYKDTEVAPSLLYISSLAPHSAMLALSSHCLSTLRRQSASPTPASNTIPPSSADADSPSGGVDVHVDALVNWGRADDVIELVAETLHAALSSDQPSYVASQKNVRRSVHGVKFREPLPGPACPTAALSWLMRLFVDSPRRASLVVKHGRQLYDLVNALSSHVTSMCESLISGGGRGDLCQSLAIKLLTGYTTVLTVLSAGAQYTQSQQSHSVPHNSLTHAASQLLVQLLDWAVQHCSVDNQGDGSDVRARACVAGCISECVWDCASVGAVTTSLAAVSTRWLLHVTLSHKPDVHLCVSVLCFASQVLTSCVYQLNQTNNNNNNNTAADRQHNAACEWQQFVFTDSARLTCSVLARLAEITTNSGDETAVSAAVRGDLGAALTTLAADWLRAESRDRQVGGVNGPLCDVTTALLDLVSAELCRFKLQGEDVSARESGTVTSLCRSLVCAWLRSAQCRRQMCVCLLSRLKQQQQQDQEDQQDEDEDISQGMMGVIVCVFVLSEWRSLFNYGACGGQLSELLDQLNLTSTQLQSRHINSDHSQLSLVTHFTAAAQQLSSFGVGRVASAQ